MAQGGATRTIVVEGYLSDDGYGWIPYDRDEATQVALDLLATLHQVGGMFAVTARRRQKQTDTLGDAAVTADTIALVFQYRSYSPLEKTPAPAREEPEAEAEPDDDVEELELDAGEWDDDAPLLSEKPDMEGVT